MTKLRHIHGPNLIELEKILEGVKNIIVLKGVNYVGANWYIHFLLQDTWNEDVPVKTEKSIETKQLQKNRKGK